jgi:site-specific recombinase XerD
MNTAVAPYAASLDLMIRAWLHEKEGRSHSAGTAKLYERTLTEFRNLLRANGLDLDDPRIGDIARAIQGWASKPVLNGKVTLAPSTHNNRVAILSSFYEYAIRHEFLHQNPCDRVNRQVVQRYATAKALSVEEVSRKLREIDRTTLLGLRDYAMFAVSFTTGRRLSAVAALSPSDVRIEGTLQSPDTFKVTIEWPREKGGKLVRDTLAPAVAKALHDYMTALGQEFDLAEVPTLWVSLARNGYKGSGLSTMGIRHITEQRLGTTRFHALRHTFAAAMEASGATVSEIQHRLGHQSLATTGLYLAQLRSDQNPHAGKLAETFGIVQRV